MVAALIFVISLAAAVQFAVFSWRAALLASGAEPLSEAARAAVDQLAGELNPPNFRAVTALHEICPNLHSKSVGDLRHIQLYFRVLEALDVVASSVMPACSAWSQREMAACTRYAAVAVDKRLRSNQLCVAELSSF